MWLAIVREIWKHKNKVIFCNGRVDEVETFATTQLTAWSWARTDRQIIHFSFPEWCISPKVCLSKIR